MAFTPEEEQAAKDLERLILLQQRKQEIRKGRAERRSEFKAKYGNTFNPARKIENEENGRMFELMVNGDMDVLCQAQAEVDAEERQARRAAEPVSNYAPANVAPMVNIDAKPNSRGRTSR